MILKIGVTGHRFFLNEEKVRQEVRKHLHQLKNIASEFEIISPLADGADMLVTEEAIITLDAKLSVILPYELDEYKKSIVDKNRFNSLFSKKEKIEILGFDGTFTVLNKEHQYYLCGKKIVDICDLLIVLYDGLPSKGLGGTAEIVAYSKAIDKKMIHIKVTR